MGSKISQENCTRKGYQNWNCTRLELHNKKWYTNSDTLLHKRNGYFYLDLHKYNCIKLYIIVCISVYEYITIIKGVQGKTS